MTAPRAVAASQSAPNLPCAHNPSSSLALWSLSALAAVLFLSRLSMHGCHVVGRGGGNHAAAPWPASTSVFDQYGHGVDQPPGTAPLASVFVGLTDCPVPSWLRLWSDLTDGALYACAGLPLSSGDGRPSTSEGVRTLGAVS